VLRGLAADAFVVLDEVHHAGDDRSWGSSVLTAFGAARRRLSISGRRSGPTRPPSLRRVPPRRGTARLRVRLRRRAVRRPRRAARLLPRDGRPHGVGRARRVEVEASFDDELDAQRANQRLRTALSLEGQWLTAVLDEAQGRLTDPARPPAERRRTRHRHGPGARAGPSPRSCGAATAPGRRWPSATTRWPPRRSSGSRRGDDSWIVAVRMVSEGVDIPRLRVGVFATNTTTELFFRQAVGRLVRWTPGRGAQPAFLFIPDDPRLRRWATGIAEQRRHSLGAASPGGRGDVDPSAFDDARPSREPTTTASRCRCSP
jgi:hypothetical protein